MTFINIIFLWKKVSRSYCGYVNFIVSTMLNKPSQCLISKTMW